MVLPEDVSVLVDEYRRLFAGRSVKDCELLQRRLQELGEWTPRASEHLIELARNYGSFMLRNALAVSLALEIEDGCFGF